MGVASLEFGVARMGKAAWMRRASSISRVRGRCVIVTGAGRYRRMRAQALLEAVNHLAQGTAHPARLSAHVGLLFRVLDQVENPGRLEMVGTCVGLGFPHDVHFPVAPFCRTQLLLDVVDEAVAVRLLLPAAKKVELVDAVERP